MTRLALGSCVLLLFVPILMVIGSGRREDPVRQEDSRAPLRAEVGRPFPTLALPALADGRPVSVADFRGKKIILHVFASW